MRMTGHATAPAIQARFALWAVADCVDVTDTATVRQGWGMKWVSDDSYLELGAEKTTK